MRFTTLWLLGLLICTSALGATITVDPAGGGDYTTIRDAILAANNGDVIELVDDVYTGGDNRNLDYLGKAITIRSQSGNAEDCIIDCEYYGRGFYFHMGEGPGSILEYVTIMRGRMGSDSGGGIDIEGSASPTIRHNVIKQCVANGGGGGICIHFTYQQYGSALILDNVIADNSSGYKGGGIWCSSNAAGNPIISGNTIIRNHANGEGGGIYATSYATITGNAIDGNDADFGGGIMCGSWFTATVANNTISNNFANNFGGGIACKFNSSPSIDNNTITGNSAGSFGGGIAVDEECGPTIINTILWGNSAPTGQEIWLRDDSHAVISYSVVDGGQASTYIPGGCSLNWGSGMLTADPDFTSGPQGPFYLSHTSAGQGIDSPCINSGSASAAGICFATGAGTVCMDDLSTRSDLVNDTGTVDIGCHPVANSPMTYMINAQGTGDFANIQAAVTAAEMGDLILLMNGTYQGPGNRDINFEGMAITIRSESGNPEDVTIDCQGSAGSPHRGFIFNNGERYGSVLEGVTVINGHAAGSWPDNSGGGILLYSASPSISNCIIADCTAEWAGGLYLYSGANPRLLDCVIADNDADEAGGLACYQAYPSIAGCTIVGNSASLGSGMSFFQCDPAISNTIVAYNINGEQAVYVDDGWGAIFTCSDIYGNDGGNWTEHIEDQYPGDGNLSSNPRFCDAGNGDYSLGSNSPCAEENNPGCGQIGARSVGCGEIFDTYVIQPDGGGDHQKIQDAIDASSDGDIILLADGVFTGEGNRDIDCLGLAITIGSQSGDPEVCIIDCQGSAGDEHRGFYFHNGETPATVVEYLTITGGYVERGGGIYCTTDAAPTIRGNVITENTATVNGGGVNVLFATPAFIDNIVSNNSANRGGGFYMVWGGSETFSGNLIYGNSATSSGGGISFPSNTSPVATENTIVANSAPIGAGIDLDQGSFPHFHNTIVAFNLVGSGVNFGIGGEGHFHCSDVFGNAGGDWSGYSTDQTGIDGNISQDPLFCNIAGEDFTLDIISPCTEANSSCGQMGVLGVGCGSSVSYALIQPDGSGDYATIQLGIDAVISGGVVELANGTYIGNGNHDLDFGGKDLTVQSQSGDPVLCIIDCQANPGDTHRGFYFHQGETSASVVQNLTVINGFHDYGGGIACSNSSPQFVNVVVADCESPLSGGGLYITQGSTTQMTGCEVRDNVSGSKGGAICVHLASPVLDDCQFSENHAADDGGAIYCNEDLTVTNSHFEGNTSIGDGGGINFSGDECEISNCTLIGNMALHEGGGIYCRDSAPLISNCLFEGNDGVQSAGGIKCDTGADPNILDCTFIANTTDNLGGAIGLENSNPTITGCTLYGNSAINGGSGLRLYNSSPVLDGNIIAFGIVGDVVTCGGSNSPTIHCTDIYGNAGGDWIGCIAAFAGLAGNISEDPLFCDAAGGDFTLYEGSPCSADESACGQMGAFGVGCSQPITSYLVYPDGSGDWQTIQVAIDAASAGDTVLLATGTFTGPGNYDLQMKSSLTLRSQSGAPADVTVDAQGLGRCMVGDGISGTLVEGITFTGGVSPGSDYEDSGSGIFMDYSDINLSQCVITGNAGYGGGIYSYNSTFTLTECDIHNNGGDGLGLYSYSGNDGFILNSCSVRENAGTGIDLSHLPDVASPWLTANDCQITGNTGIGVWAHGHSMVHLYGSDISDNGGGGVSTRYEGDIDGCQFAGNSGTGISFSCTMMYPAVLSVTNCSFIGNAGNGISAGLEGNEWEESHLEIEGCTFYGASGYGGVNLSLPEDTSSSIDGCTFYDCTPGIACDDFGRTTVSNTVIAFASYGPGVEGIPDLNCCDIYGNNGGDWTGDIAGQLGQDGNISADPLFCDAEGGNYTLAQGSPCSADESPCGQIGAYGVGCVQHPTEDIIGLYADEAGTINMLQVDYGQTVTLYLIIKEATNQSGVMCWEMTLPVPDGLVLVEMEPRGDSPTVMGTPPEYLVCISELLPYSDNIVLAEFTYLVMETEPRDLFITAIGSSSADPPAPVYIPGDDPSLIISLTPSSGSEDLPVFILNPDVDTYWVNPDGSGDFATIQDALDNVAHGDTIILGSGTFTGPGNRDLDTGGSAVTIRSAGRSAEDCIIDCEGLGRAFFFHNNEGPMTVLEEITITNGYAAYEGGAILLGVEGEISASPTIRNCVFLDNVSDGSGGALSIRSLSHPQVSGCLFSGNTTGSYGGGVCVDFGSNPTFTSCTFYSNVCTSGSSSDGGGLWISSDASSANNCIFWENSAAMGSQIGLQNGATLDLSCSDVMGGQTGIHVEGGSTLNWDENNIWNNPLFCNAYEGEFTLASASPCLPANNDCGELMGAYGEGCDAVDAPEDIAPMSYYLAQNSPNPFNPTTEIRFGLPTAGSVDLKIYDVSGRCVSTLLDGQDLPASHHRVEWHGRDDSGRQLASGVYFYRLEVGRYSQTEKMILLK